jgi:hypothetical protein
MTATNPFTHEMERLRPKMDKLRFHMQDGMRFAASEKGSPGQLARDARRAFWNAVRHRNLYDAVAEYARMTCHQNAPEGIYCESFLYWLAMDLERGSEFAADTASHITSPDLLRKFADECFEFACVAANMEDEDWRAFRQLSAGIELRAEADRRSAAREDAAAEFMAAVWEHPCEEADQVAALSESIRVDGCD